MKAKLRRTGIDALGDIAWGTHFCQFYHTTDDLLSILTPYFRAGLESGEFCVWVISAPLNRQEALRAAEVGIPRFGDYLARGQVEVIPHTEWYLKDGYFDMKRVLNGWLDKLDKAAAMGYEGLRVSGNTGWLEADSWRSFAEYEEEINNFIGKYRMLAMCTYCLDRCGASEVIDVVNNHQFALIRRDGQWAIVESYERKRVREILEQSEANYRALVESSPDGVISFDGKGTIIDCNEEVCRLVGVSKEEIKGKDFRDLLARPVPQEFSSNYARLAQVGQVEDEFEILGRDGQVVPVWAKTVALYESNGDFNRAVVYLRDIAERRKVEQLKDEFIGLVSHELRSPLTVIVGAINTALSEGDRLSPAETRQLLQDAALEAESLSSLVWNLLELSRAQADRLVLHPEPVSLEKVARNAVDRVKHQGSAHQSLQFLIEVPTELPRVYADELRLERILCNLLDNAVKYSPGGGEIRVTAEANDDNILVSVIDQGIGMSPDDQVKLFGPFQRVEDSRAHGVRGAGLGLLVCRRLVEAHHGRIWVESERGRGSAFRFTLPL
ncbi:MAG: hypothetical protein DRI39_02210 [Chloroflexi bacterium]|nr:MAG: hypothetical protein DRI39_02210 [Chloroflexota bacterium]RLC97079.1 MAG: hypothetical protein DRI40_01330 [Chloroflexota bacterium]